MLQSDVLFWAVSRLAPSLVINSLLATPVSVVQNASESEQARVRQLFEHLLPISQRRLGLLNEAKVIPGIPRYELEQISVPTLTFSCADDSFGTYDVARYTAEQVPGGRFVGYPTGGHLLVGHQQEVMDEIVRLLE